MSDKNYNRTPDWSSFPLFASADKLPPRSRKNDRPTSIAAGESIDGLPPIVYHLLAAYKAAGVAGLIDEEAALASESDMRSCWWKRCGELRALGLIVETGETRKSSRNRLCIVCRAVRL